MKADRLPQVKLDHVVPKGGLDLVTAPMQRKPGTCRAAENFECDLDGGYTRIAGYARYGLQPNLDRQQFYDVSLRGNFTGASTYALIYNSSLVVGKTSGASGRLCTKVTAGTLASVLSTLAAGTNYTSSTYLSTGTPVLAARMYDVSGVFELGEEVVLLTEERAEYPILYSFDGTVTVESVPEPISGVTPAALALEKYYSVVGVLLDVGPSVAAVGGLMMLGVVDAPIGPYVFAKSLNTSSGTTYLYVVRPQQITTLPRNYWGWTTASAWSVTPASAWQPEVPDYVEAVKYNFSGAAGEDELFCVTGAGQAFEFTPSTDTVTFLPTGMATDKPEHVAAHKNRLFLSFGGSLQFSTAGDPTDWSPVTGAGELAVGEQITKLQSVVGGSESVLMVYTTSRIYGLYGDATADFRLILLASDIHVEPDSIQMLDRPVFITDNGITVLSASDTFGNFQASSLSKQIAPFLNQRRRRVVSSTVVRSKNQYRVFFEDGSGLYCTFDNGKLVGILPVRLGVTPISLMTYFSEVDNEDVTLFCSTTTPWVYRMDNGTHFDGYDIDYFLLMSFASSRSARVNKAYRKATLEIQSDGGYVAFDAAGETDYASMSTAPTPFATVENPGESALSNWDEALWDEFVWDGYSLTPTELSLDGSGENVSIMLRGQSEIVSPFTLAGVTLQYINRRLKR